MRWIIPIDLNRQPTLYSGYKCVMTFAIEVNIMNVHVAPVEYVMLSVKCAYSKIESQIRYRHLGDFTFANSALFVVSIDRKY